MKTLLFFILFLSLNSNATTYFIDPLANLVYYDIKKDKTPNHFEKNVYNTELIDSLKNEKKIYIFNEFSGLGSLNLKELPQAKYIEPPAVFLDSFFLKLNEWGFVKTDDFFLTPDSIFLSFFTWHPFNKMLKIKEVLKSIPKKEKIVIITTTWKSGEALYKNILKDYPNVVYIVRDLNLNKTLYANLKPYPFVFNSNNTKYIIFDSPACQEIFNLSNQAQSISSNEVFTKKHIYSESNKIERKIINKLIAKYKKTFCQKP